MAFVPTAAFAGCQPIHTTSTTQAHPIGTRVRAADPYYGEATFVYMPGVASTALGDACILDSWNKTTARAVTSSAAIGSIGIAMSANVASQYGWYLVEGAALCNGLTSCAVGKLYISGTAGSLDDGVIAHNHVFGANCTLREGNNASYAGTGKIVAQLSFPTCDNLGSALSTL
jgi:hypothetical protein